jgi:hypothetical protein
MVHRAANVIRLGLSAGRCQIKPRISALSPKRPAYFSIAYDLETVGIPRFWLSALRGASAADPHRNVRPPDAIARNRAVPPRHQT